MAEPIKNGEKDGDGSKKSAEKLYYTILAPKSFRANSEFTLNITVHDETGQLSEAAMLRASIEDNHSHPEFKVHRDITVKPNVTQVVTIPIGNVPIDGNYKLVLKGISGIKLERESVLDLLTKTHAILIQTDKALYKPSDCMKFRVLALNSEMKAAAINKNELSITISVS